MNETDEAALEQPARAGLVPIVMGIAVLAVAALVPWALGVGVFGARLFASEVQVHIVNLSSHDVTVALDFAAPVEAGAGSLHSTETLAGQVTFVATDGSGEEVDIVRERLGGEVVYNVAGAACFAVFDVTSFYSGAPSPQLRVTRRVEAGTRIVPIEADTLILPRRPPPAEAAGTVHWIEDVRCEALSTDQEAELQTWAEYRMLSRFERLQEAQRAAEQQR